MTRGHRTLAAALSFVAAAACAGPAGADEAAPAATARTGPVALRFRLPDDTIAYRGVANFDHAGLEDPSFLYVGGPIGLLAGVIVHSVLTDKRRERQKADLQARADDVFAPYADALSQFGQRDLLERSFAGMTTAGDKRVAAAEPDPGAWTIDYAPVFAMHRDGRSVVLDNVVSITRGREPGSSPLPATIRETIRVVSGARPGNDPEMYWADDDAVRLKAESAALLALSFDIAMMQARRAETATPAVPVQRTLRYRLGSDERMERAELLVQGCDRLLMRTLRGWLLSAPVARPPASDGDGRPCAPASEASMRDGPSGDR